MVRPPRPLSPCPRSSCRADWDGCGRSVKALAEALGTQRPYVPAHVLLFVGTKLACQVTRPRTAELSPADVFLLTLFVKSAQDPPPPTPAPSTVVPSEAEGASSLRQQLADADEVRRPGHPIMAQTGGSAGALWRGLAQEYEMAREDMSPMPEVAEGTHVKQESEVGSDTFEASNDDYVRRLPRKLGHAWYAPAQTVGDAAARCCRRRCPT
jgi:hypothetical protein